jgi:hypothetical protein
MKNLKIFIYLTILYLGYVLYLTKNKSPVMDESYDQEKNLKSYSTPPLSNHKNNEKKDSGKLQFKKVERKKQRPSSAKKDKLESNIKTPQLTLMKLSDDFIPMTEKGELIVPHVFIDGPHVLVHGDILITDLDTFNEKRMDEGLLILPKPRKWPNGIIPYEFASDLYTMDEVRRSIEYINKNTSVRLKKRENEKAYLYFKNGLNNCYSYLGYQGKKQDISLSRSCKQPHILHEIMHALGFFHEQNRSIRDEFLEVNWKNIDEKYHLNFKKIHPKAMLDPKEDFDFESILLYPPYAFALVHGEHTMIKVNGELYEGNRTGTLSEGDLSRIKKVYGTSEKIE